MPTDLFNLLILPILPSDCFTGWPFVHFASQCGQGDDQLRHLVLTVTYVLSSPPPIQAANNAVFTLTVTDCNDFPPVFTQTNYSFIISERSTIAAADEVVYSSIRATDQDGTAANRMVQYQLAGGLRSTNHLLNINPATVSKSIHTQQRSVLKLS